MKYIAASFTYAKFERLDNQTKVWYPVLLWQICQRVGNAFDDDPEGMVALPGEPGLVRIGQLDKKLYRFLNYEVSIPEA